MPKKANKDKAETKALWKTTTLFIVFGALIFAAFWWARNDDQSEVAAKLRHLLGIQLVEKQAPEPEPAPVAFEEPDEAPPPPEPFDAGEPEPAEPEPLSWEAFAGRKSLWPDALAITVDKEITLTYRGKTYGEVAFEPGQELNVFDLSENGYLYGRVGGNEMEVHVSATNFSDWFAKTHGENYVLSSLPKRENTERVEDFEEELITKLRIWCLKNYKTPLIEINEDNLVLRWHSRSGNGGEADYSLEALSVARAYLSIQAQLGGHDNYASCEIRDPDTGRLMGSKGIFIPRF
jgi:hypothetical protein